MHPILRVLAGCAALALLGGCAAHSPEAKLPAPRPLGGTLPAYQAPRRRAPTAPAPALPDVGGVLTLRTALARALLENPALAAEAWEVRAAEARAMQSGLFPNPELSADLQQVGGTGAYRRLESSQADVILSQVLPMAGKRRKAAHLGALEGDLAGWDYEARRLDVLTSTYAAFLVVLANQERLRLTQELLEVAEDALGAVTARVESGKVSPLDQAKAGILRSTAAIAHQRAGRALEASRAALASAWGGTAARFERAAGELDEVAPIPAYQDVVARIERNPDLERWVTELERRRAALVLARARGAPDLTLAGGFQRIRADDQGVWTVGLGVPLPLFDRNQGGVREAAALVEKAQAQERLAQADVRKQLAAAYASLAASHREATTLREAVLPRADQAYRAAKAGYEHGKFNYLDVLDAQRTLFEARGQFLDSLTGYHLARAAVERLIGEPLAASPLAPLAVDPTPAPALPAPPTPEPVESVSPDPPGAPGAAAQEAAEPPTSAPEAQPPGDPARYQERLRAARWLLEAALRPETDGPKGRPR